MVTFCPSTRLTIRKSSNDMTNVSSLMSLADALEEAGYDINEYKNNINQCLTWDYSHWNYTQPVTDPDDITYKNQFCAKCFTIASG